MHRVVLALCLLAGCGGEPDSSPEPEPGPEPCPPPHRQVDELCIPPGVPAALCAEGFEHDGDAACVPVLPAEPCGDGLMVVPGDTTCRAVMDCGAGTWGDIPVDATTIHVDASYTGATSDGSATQPFTSVALGVSAARPGGLVAIAAGTYAEDVVIDLPVRLWGVCPSEVAITGAGASLATVVIVGAADGTELHGVAVTSGNTAGVALSGVENVLVDRARIHDTMGFGLYASSELGPTSVTVRDSLFERNRRVGLAVSGVELAVERVMVRDSVPTSDETLGRGIDMQFDVPTSTPSSASISASVLDGNHEAGLAIKGSNATAFGLVVRNTLPRPSDLDLGRGINVQADADALVASNATLTSSFVAANHDVGVAVIGSQGILDGVVVRDTAPRQTDQDLGRGINVQRDPAGVMESGATITNSSVSNNHDLGIGVIEASAQLEGLVVRGTLPRAIDQMVARGIAIQLGPSSLASGSIHATLLADNAELGVFVAGADVTMTRLAVRDGGAGIHVQGGLDAPTTANVLDSLIERPTRFGVVVVDAMAALDGVVVTDSAASPTDGTYGDGLAAVTYDIGATVTVTNTRIERSTRAGLTNFGSQVLLSASELSCNPIDLAAETFSGQPAVFDDEGSNRCGCSNDEACKAISAALAPPTPVGLSQ